MEPLSATASILTILDSGSAIAKFFNKVRALKHAPNVLLALNNEVNDARLLVEQADGVLRKSSAMGYKEPQTVVHAVERLKEPVAELECFAAFALTKYSNKSSSLQVDNSANLDCLSYSRQTFCSVQSVHEAVLNSTSLLIEMTKEKPQDAVTETAHNIPIDESADKLCSPKPHLAESEVGPDRATALIVRDSDHQEGLQRFDQFQLNYSTCLLDCRCRCHSYQTIRSPNFLNSMLGSLFIGYRASPWLSQRCNDPACQNKATRIEVTYTFPIWLMKRHIAARLRWGDYRGVEQSLRVYYTRDTKTWDAWKWMFFENSEDLALREISRQLHKGRTSLQDITPDGNTLLHYAVSFNKWEIVAYLIRYGSDMHYKAMDGDSAFTTFWTSQLQRPKLNMEEVKTLGFWQPDQLDEFGLTDLQKVYLGLGTGDFDAQVDACPRKSVDDLDQQGRSLLSWAAGRGDHDTVSRLLLCGAEPGIRAQDGFIPLHWAAMCSSSKCVKLLLDAQADVNAATGDGRTLLHLAAAGNDLESVKLSIDYGGNINSRDRFGYTSLTHAVLYEQASVCRHLLDVGAQCRSLDVQVAIRWQSHETLSLLLKHADTKFNLDTEMILSLLYTASTYGDIQTLKILALAWCSRVDLPQYLDDWDAEQHALWRRNYNIEWANRATRSPDEDPEAWYEAWRCMLNKVRKRGLQSVDPSSDDEWITTDEETSSNESEFDEDCSNTSEDGALEGEDEMAWQDAVETL
ncbi:MAG: hypothetical protein Q9167_002908 [Letrouitia subvulpina]